MTTEKQIEANKLNAQKSTGPRTASGKSKAARNSIKHGLRSQIADVLLGEESTRQYNRFYDTLLNDLAPVGSKEIILADRIINFYWKLKRVTRMETETFHILKSKSFDNNPIIKQYRDLYTKKQPIPQNLEDASDDIENNMLGTMAVDNFASHGQIPGRTLENIQVYESRIERSLYKAQLEFQKLQFNRHQKEAKEISEAKSCLALGDLSRRSHWRRGRQDKPNAPRHPREACPVGMGGGDPVSSNYETNPNPCSTAAYMVSLPNPPRL